MVKQTLLPWNLKKTWQRLTDVLFQKEMSEVSFTRLFMATFVDRLLCVALVSPDQFDICHVRQDTKKPREGKMKIKNRGRYQEVGSIRCRSRSISALYINAKVASKPVLSLVNAYRVKSGAFGRHWECHEIFVCARAVATQLGAKRYTGATGIGYARLLFLNIFLFGRLGSCAVKWA